MNHITTFIVWKKTVAMVVFMVEPDKSAEEQVMKFLTEPNKQEGNA